MAFTLLTVSGGLQWPPLVRHAGQLERLLSKTHWDVGGCRRFPYDCTIMKSVYIETSIVSYLTSRPSRDLRAAAWQQITTQWWEQERPKHELCNGERPRHGLLAHVELPTH